jgi:hypothetical protein
MPQKYVGQGSLREVGTVPLILIQRNVWEKFRSEWGTRELRWALEPMTGLQAAEHEFICVSRDDPETIDTISVYKRDDSGRKTLFEINVMGSHVGQVRRIA